MDHMHHRICTGAMLGLALLSLLFAPEQASAQQKLPNGSIAAQVVGRIKVQSDFSIRMYGYFTSMEGISGPIFNGSPSENTAMFTFAADTTSAAIIKNGDLVHGIDNPTNGSYTTLSVYYSPAPANRDFSNPDDFTRAAQLVAQYRSRSGAMSLLQGGSFQASAGLSLVATNFFFANGQSLTLGNAANGLSLTLFGPAPAFDGILAALGTDGSFMIPFSGTAISAGQ
jgi:hypothetical protein